MLSQNRKVWSSELKNFRKRTRVRNATTIWFIFHDFQDLYAPCVFDRMQALQQLSFP